MVVERPPFEPATRLPQIGYAREGVPPPSPLYIAADERLEVAGWNSRSPQGLLIRGRLLLPAGTIQYFERTLVLTADRAETSVLIPLPESFLLGLHIEPDQVPTRRGETFVRARINKGISGAGIITSHLISDYVDSTHHLSWPYGVQRSSLDGQGNLRIITGTDPAAGAELTETVPTNARWRLLAVRAALTTSATAANRQVQFVLDDGATRFYSVSAASVQTASQTLGYSWAPVGMEHDVRQGAYTIPLPNPCLLPASARFRTITTNLQAGDNWGAPLYLVEEWIEE